MKIGEKVGEYIKAQGISIPELAKTAGLKERRVTDIISGKTEFETKDYIAICRALMVGLDYFTDYPSEKALLKNLQHEQDERGFTDKEIAGFLGTNPDDYRQKKVSAKFSVTECRLLCKLFGTSFDYLFATDSDI